MISWRNAWSILFVTAFFSSCYGRIDDRKGHQPRLRHESFGLSGDRSAVIVFSAAWCKPCRHEIPAFNQLKAYYGDRLDVVGMMVEGNESGSIPTADDLKSFSNAEGERPAFPLSADRGWKLFDSLMPQGGRTLPLTAFVTREGEIYSLIQRSLQFESELLPLAEALLRGEPSPQPPRQTTQPDQTKNKKPRWAQVSDWVQESGHSSESPIYLALRSSWQSGLAAQGFTDLDMPFEKGSFKIDPASESTPETVLSGEWRSDSGCSLTVGFKPDGTYAGSSGICNTGG